MKRALPIMLVSMLAGAVAAQELGRAALPPAVHEGFALGGSWGIKAGLGWSRADWDLDPADGAEWHFAPQGSLFYKATDQLDVNLSCLFISAEDEDKELGTTEADMTRLALGVRYWLPTSSRITPYFGAGLGYCFLDAKTERTREDGAIVNVWDVEVEDAPGLFLEAGLAFQISDDFFITADLTYDRLLGDADAEINGRGEDFDIQAFAINLGVAWIF